MRFSFRPLLLLSFLICLLSACSPYEKVLKSTDINYKLTKANEYYDKKWYMRANELYKTLLPVMKGTKNYEALYYRYAWSFYYQKDYLSAAYHFKNFTDFFPRSKDLEEMEFMHAVSLFKMSPKSSLEQTNTIRAMEALQVFINMHPESKRLAEANSYMDQGRKKLEAKEATAAQLYYNIGQYKAAAIAFKEVINQYPESPQADHYQLMVVKALYQYARQSVETRQEERFGNTAGAARELKEAYPTSKYVKDAEHYETLSNNYIKKLRNEQS